MNVLRASLVALSVQAVASASASTLPPAAVLQPRHVRDVSSPSTTSAAPANPTICGDLINSVNDGISYYFNASEAYDCLTSVPFNPAVATRFLDYLNTTMQFHSTLAFLRNPPAGYQQPAVDVEHVLQEIAANVTAGRYQNQYDFEADVMQLVHAMHDTHVDLLSGILSTFTFGSGFALVSASADGVEPPKVYIADDILQRRDFGYSISAIATINGEDVVDFLSRLAMQNSKGTVEPHADWNQLMYSPVQSILDNNDVFSGGVTFYPGGDLNITYENGTDPVETSWLAAYTVSTFTGPVTTGGDYYNFFVLGNIPASYDEVPLPDVFNATTNDVDNLTAPDPLQNWYNTTYGAYPPNPVVVQDNLLAGVAGGVVTGYILEDLSTGVLSIPSFSELGSDTVSFGQAVVDFVNNATDKHCERILIDLQGNLGGQVLLAFTTFGTFFPNIKPFAGSRRRSHPLANVVGNAYWSSPPLTNVSETTTEADEWVVTDRINAATGHNFSSWSQYYGPLSEDDDYFSLVEQYDLSKINFQAANFDTWNTPKYIADPDVSATPPFEPSQIVILTDGLCASTCTLFLEMMTHQAGVRTVVVGGRPEAGPMQAGSGTRGAFAYSADMLDVNFAHANLVSNHTTAAQLPLLDPDTDTRDSGMVVSFLGLNLRDQVRTVSESPNVPLQFMYLAADCRIYFTLDSILNVTALWRDAVAAMWLDSSRCVANSTGYGNNTGNGTAFPPPARPDAHFDFPSASKLHQHPKSNSTSDMDLTDGLWDGISQLPRPRVHLCDTENPPACQAPLQCTLVTYSCSRYNNENVTRHICVPPCNNVNKRCRGQMWCSVGQVPSGDRLIGQAAIGGKRTVKNGHCAPYYGEDFPSISCDAVREEGNEQVISRDLIEYV